MADDAPRMYRDPQTLAREERYAQLREEMAPKPVPAPEPQGVTQAVPVDPVNPQTDPGFYADPTVEDAARDAAAAVEANGGTPLEQREAAMMAAAKAVKAQANPQDGADLADITNQITEEASVRDEIKALREQLAERDAKITPHEATELTDAEYFEARKAGKLSGIRRPNYGPNGGLR